VPAKLTVMTIVRTQKLVCMAYKSTPATAMYLVSRAQIEHYDMAVGARLLWLINSQSFLFGIYVGASLFMPPTPELKVKEQLLAMAVPVMGLLIAIFTAFDMITSLSQMDKLWKNYKDYNDGEDRENELPPINGDLFDRLIHKISPIISTVVFLMTWSFLLLKDLKVF